MVCQKKELRRRKDGGVLEIMYDVSVSTRSTSGIQHEHDDGEECKSHTEKQQRFHIN